MKQQIGNEWGYDWLNAVLNGIAYHRTRKTYFVTGKLWDFIFEIKLRE